MTSRDRFHAVMDFRPFDRLPVLEWAAWWPETLSRWYEEGLDPELTDRYEICQHFGLEMYLQAWCRAISPEAHRHCHPGIGSVKTLADYEYLRPHLFRLDNTWPVKMAQLERWAQAQSTGDVVIWLTVDGFFWLPRTLMGIENHLYAFYDAPSLMRRINADNVAWILSLLEQVCAVVTPDFITFAEDMSYNHGPMISQDLFEAFITPCYQAVMPALRSRGIRAIADSDGDVHEATGWLSTAGLDGILPLERQAGVDMARLRKDYPDQRFIGGFDKMAMSRGEAAMREEFERLLPVAARGGYIISCDHQTPPGVSLEQYKLYVSLFQEYAEAAGAMCRRTL